jgi:alkylation response protein AidB-like acyl-CoA dehydrogenase
MTDPVSAFDWEIIKKGSRLGFRTAVVPKEYGDHGIDVTQTLAMIELARGDCGIARASQALYLRDRTIIKSGALAGTRSRKPRVPRSSTHFA